jgi:acetamidase/formamidase/dienelactone hydrolase
VNGISGALIAIVSSAVLALQSSPPSSVRPEQVTVVSGSKMLRGLIWRPAGQGPFPAVLFNHGSYLRADAMSPETPAIVGPLFARHGYAFLFFFRQGIGLSADQGTADGDLMQRAYEQRGNEARNRVQLDLLNGEELDEVRAALQFLLRRPEVDPRRIGVVGHSFGGSLSLVLASVAPDVRTTVVFGPAAASWERSPGLQRRLIDAVRRTPIPVMFVQAENDYSIAPGKALAAEMDRAHTPHALKIYPPFGATAAEGHNLVFGSPSTWEADVFAFLDAHLAVRAAAQLAAPKVHRLEATSKTVAYGYYWSEAAPALRIRSGDVIDVDTLLTNTPMGLERAGLPPAKVQPSLRAIVADVTGDRRGPGGHILTGPVYVEGAEPGDALEVKVLSIDFPIDYGYNGCRGFIPSNCDASVPQKILTLDAKTMTAVFKPGIVIPLKPFFGSMGVAPAPALGRVSSNPSGRHAGNLDNRELGVGSTLYIPVFVPGALFEIGDGHAAQGDGEVDQTAIETSLRGRVQLTVRKDMKLVWPRAETSTDYISMAADESLETATAIAIQEMVDFLSASKKLTTHEAYQLVSIAGNVAITQLVDRPVFGVHVKMPKAIFK